MKILVVEDSQHRIRFFKKALIGHNVHFAENYDEAIEKLQDNDNYDLMYLDHDLEDEHYLEARKELERTGYEVVKWIVNNKSHKSAYMFIHSLNPIGSRRMYEHLKKHGYNTELRSYLRLVNMVDD